jgi:hypothetical protein
MEDIQHYKACVVTNFVQFYRLPSTKLWGIVTRVDIMT